jgi:hypothetical protein
VSNNDFRFLLTMPSDLNTAIETVSSSLHKSKSAFIREGVRRYLREGKFVGLDEKESHGTRFGRLVEVCRPPWGLLIVWFFVSLGVTSIFLYYCDYFIKS